MSAARAARVRRRIKSGAAQGFGWQPPRRGPETGPDRHLVPSLIPVLFGCDPSWITVTLITRVSPGKLVQAQATIESYTTAFW